MTQTLERREVLLRLAGAGGRERNSGKAYYCRCSFPARTPAIVVKSANSKVEHCAICSDSALNFAESMSKSIFFVPVHLLMGVLLLASATNATKMRVVDVPLTANELYDERMLGSSSSIQAQMLAAVNVERAKVGVSALCTNSKLQSAAQGHSNDMAAKNYMGHTGSDGTRPSQRITSTGYQWTAVAENVAAGQSDVTAVMKSWMNSTGHRKNLLNAKYTQFGMGYAYSSSTTYKRYWTQNFGTSSSESCG